MDKQCSNFYTKDMSLDAVRQRIRCAWALKGKDNGKNNDEGFDTLHMISLIHVYALAQIRQIK